MERACSFWLIGMKFLPTLDLTRYFLFLTYINELECSLNMKRWILKLLSWVMSSFVYCVPFSLLLHQRLWLCCNHFDCFRLLSMDYYFLHIGTIIFLSFMGYTEIWYIPFLSHVKFIKTDTYLKYNKSPYGQSKSNKSSS